VKSIDFHRDKNNETDEVQMIPILETVEESNDPFCATRGADQGGILQNVALGTNVPLLAFT